MSSCKKDAGTDPHKHTDNHTPTHTHTHTVTPTQLCSLSFTVLYSLFISFMSLSGLFYIFSYYMVVIPSTPIFLFLFFSATSNFPQYFSLLSWLRIYGVNILPPPSPSTRSLRALSPAPSCELWSQTPWRLSWRNRRPSRGSRIRMRRKIRYGVQPHTPHLKGKSTTFRNLVS